QLRLQVCHLGLQRHHWRRLGLHHAARCAGWQRILLERCCGRRLLGGFAGTHRAEDLQAVRHRVLGLGGRRRSRALSRQLDSSGLRRQLDSSGLGRLSLLCFLHLHLADSGLLRAALGRRGARQQIVQRPHRPSHRPRRGGRGGRLGLGQDGPLLGVRDLVITLAHRG
ncbi:unnamed protein product, partial [Heterosigma akashiwo]